MDAYVIIGPPGTRKSTLIRCLTGCETRHVRDILLTSEIVLPVYIRTSTLQAVHTSPKDFIKEVNLMHSRAVIFSLWPWSNPNHPELYPDAISYLNDFISVGWNIKKVAILDKAHSTPYRKFKLISLPDVRREPINRTAQQLREHFGWV